MEELLLWVALTPSTYVAQKRGYEFHNIYKNDLFWTSMAKLKLDLFEKLPLIFL